MRDVILSFAAMLALAACGAASRRPDLAQILGNGRSTIRVDPLPGGHGTAIVLTDDGFLLTAAHVACGDGVTGLQLTVEEKPGEPVAYEARLVTCDLEADLAVLKIDRAFAHVVVLATDADVAELADGDPVYSVGYPYFFGKLVTRGYVMAKNYTNRLIGLKDVLVVELSGGGGSSGSGVFDARNGKVLALYIQAIIVQAEGRPDMIIRPGIPVARIRAFLDRLGVPYRTEFPEAALEAGGPRTDVPEVKIVITPLRE